MYNKLMDFKTWINEKFIIWRGNSRASITDFARYLDVSQQTLDKWMNQSFTPSTRSLPKVAAKFPDVYSVLGLSGPVVPVSVWLSELPPDKRRVFAEAWEEALGYISDAGVEIDTPKGADIINKVLARYGL